MPKPKSNKNYFTADTEAAILKFNKEQDPEIRSRIYRDELHYPFFKLTQNIIHTFKFYHTEENNLEDLQHEIITFLITKFHLFDPSKGAKAYSYFGTITKRYLIAANAKNYKKKTETYSLDNLKLEDESGLGQYSEFVDESLEENKHENYLHPVDELSDFLDAFVEFCTENIYAMFPKQEDAQVADAILELFRRRETLSVLNKKALYIYVREQVNAKTPKITKISKILGEYFKKFYSEYSENGIVNFKI